MRFLNKLTILAAAAVPFLMPVTASAETARVACPKSDAACAKAHAAKAKTSAHSHKAAKPHKAAVAKKPKTKQHAKRPAKGGGEGGMNGMASWYGGAFHGRKTANGERYDMWALTAAHKTLPFGTRVRVTNTRNGDSVTVRINDRGPFVAGRIIDLSRAAASEIGLTASGVAPVRVTVLGRG